MKIFLSYSNEDQITHRIEDIADFLEFQSEVERVFYWARDAKGGELFDEYMRTSIFSCDTMIVIFTSNTIDSIPVFEEIGMAKAFQKPILPVFDEIENILANIGERRGVKFSMDFRNFCNQLYFTLCGKQAMHKETSPIYQVKKKIQEEFDLARDNYIEPQIAKIPSSNSYNDFEESELPSISYRVFKFMIMESKNNKNISFLNGIPGSGKSTVLKLLKYDILNDILYEKYVPVLCDASDIDSKNLLEYFYDYLLPDSEKRYYSEFLSILQLGNLVFIIDKLEDCANASDLISDLVMFCKDHTCPVIIACDKFKAEIILKDFPYHDDLHKFELQEFQDSTLFEWIVLRKSSYDSIRKYPTEKVYYSIRKKIQEDKANGKRVILKKIVEDFKPDFAP